MDLNSELMLDGNAVAGLLRDTFGAEMTLTPAECEQCGHVSELGELHAFTHAPAAVLRCPVCEHVMLRISQTPRGTYVDARGSRYLCLPR
jgi:predicted Zn-ribbon and HTH transcriptional regulator